MRFSADIVARDFPDARTFLIAHKPYMERRALATWQAQYPRPYDRAVATSRPETIEEHLERSGVGLHRLANILAGDVERMERYAALGYQTDQGPLPPDVRQALDSLSALGYTAHRPK